MTKKRRGPPPSEIDFTELDAAIIAHCARSYMHPSSNDSIVDIAAATCPTREPFRAVCARCYDLADAGKLRFDKTEKRWRVVGAPLTVVERMRARGLMREIEPIPEE